MDGVERLTQMNEVERMREVMDVISDNMRKQNDKDRMEMLASTTAMETNLMAVNFARRANTQVTGTKTKREKKMALMKGVAQAKNEKGKEVNATQKTQPNNQSTQNQQQPNQPPPNTLATRTQQAMDKKKRLASKGTLAPIGTFGTV